MKARTALLLAACVGCGGLVTDRSKTFNTTDAGTSVHPVPPPDAAVDPLDAGASTVDAEVDAPSGSWCATTHPWSNPPLSLCDDFDLSTMPRSEWSAVGVLNVVGMPSQSAPHALEAKAAAMTSSYLTFDAANVIGGKLEAELQLVDDGTTTTGSNPVLASLAGPGGKRIALEALPGTNTGRCTFEGFTSSGPPFVDFTLSRGAIWHSVSMKISFASNNNVTTVNLICVVDGTDHGLYGLTATSNAGTATIDVGVRGMTTGPMEAYFDNVAIDVEK